jgi:hypothetical protein
MTLTRLVGGYQCCTEEHYLHLQDVSEPQYVEVKVKEICIVTLGLTAMKMEAVGSSETFVPSFQTGIIQKTTM